MAPVYDTDIARERWQQEEWKHYELWEHVEQRLRRRRWAWIAAAVVTFVAISAIPVIVERWPKWTTRRAARLLAEEVANLKRMASLEHAAYRIRFAPGHGSLAYIVEKGTDCGMSDASQVKEGSLEGISKGYQLVGATLAQELKLPGLIDRFCYDSHRGGGTRDSEVVSSNASAVGMAIAPVKDLTEKNFNRMSVVLLTLPSAEISFE